MISPMFIGAEVAIGEAELCIRLRYLANPLTHTKRQHRKQGVWNSLRMICATHPGDHRPLLTTYTQDRLHNHRVTA